MNVLTQNKKAYFDYQILEKFEAGVVLIGQEVKSMKNGKASLKGAYVVPKDNELYLIGCHVPAYQPKNAVNYDPERSRKLLLTKKEICLLIEKTKEKGLTLIPLRVYTKKSLVKVEIGVAKGKRKFDKRQLIKKRDIDARLRASLKGG
jgi:SsrA-binding protein